MIKFCYCYDENIRTFILSKNSYKFNNRILLENIIEIIYGQNRLYNKHGSHNVTILLIMICFKKICLKTKSVISNKFYSNNILSQTIILFKQYFEPNYNFIQTIF